MLFEYLFFAASVRFCVNRARKWRPDQMQAPGRMRRPISTSADSAPSGYRPMIILRLIPQQAIGSLSGIDLSHGPTPDVIRLLRSAACWNLFSLRACV